MPVRMRILFLTFSNEPAFLKKKKKSLFEFSACKIDLFKPE